MGRIAASRSFVFGLALIALSPFAPGHSQAQQMYWTSEGKIQQADLDGNVVTDLITSGIQRPLGVTLDQTGGKMYWADTAAGKIQRANLDGTELEDLVVQGLKAPHDVVLDLRARRMYWTDSQAGKIGRARLDGTSREDVIASGLSEPRGIALDLATAKLYWTDGGSGKIQRANLDGSEVEDIVTGLGSPYSIDLYFSSNKLYWTDMNSGKIQRSNFDGSEVEDVITGLNTPYGIALDFSSERIYWIDNPTIKRASLEGENVEDLTTSVGSHPRDLALGLATECSLVIDMIEGEVEFAGENFEVPSCACASRAGAVRSMNKLECDQYLRGGGLFLVGGQTDFDNDGFAGSVVSPVGGPTAPGGGASVGSVGSP